MPLIKLQKQTDLIDYKDDYAKILMQFSADWCGPCQRITPQITNKFEHLNTEQILYLYIDIDKHRPLSTSFNVNSVPTFFIYDRESDLLMDPITTSDINTLSKYCINNGININESSY